MSGQAGEAAAYFSGRSAFGQFGKDAYEESEKGGEQEMRFLLTQQR